MTESRFATNKKGRTEPPPAFLTHNKAYHAEIKAAHAYLSQFRAGDQALVTDEMGRVYAATVRPGRLSEGNYGSWESYTVPMSLGPGRYTFDVTSHKLAMGDIGVALAPAGYKVCRLCSKTIERKPYVGETWQAAGDDVCYASKTLAGLHHPR
jgi:hypothetical protein